MRRIILALFVLGLALVVGLFVQRRGEAREATAISVPSDAAEDTLGAAPEGLHSARSPVVDEPRIAVSDAQAEAPTGVASDAPALVRGTVHTPEGVPVAGAEVFGPEEQWLATSDDEGAFEVAGIVDRFELEARAPGYESVATAAGSLAPGERLEHVALVLARVRTLRGIVVDAEGLPLEHAGISAEQLEPGGGSSQGLSSRSVRDTQDTTEADGLFELQQLPRIDVTLHVYHDAHFYREVPVAADVDHVRIQLGPRHEAVRVTGRVIGPQGEPVPGVKLRLAHPVRSPQVRVDDDGRFGFTTARPRDLDFPFKRDVHLLLAAEGYAQRRFVPPPLSTSEPNEYLIELEAERTIAGRVLDADERLVPGVLLRLHSSEEAWAGMDWLSWADNDRFRTDASGEFSIGGLWDGEFELRVVFPQGLVASTLVRAGDQDVTLAAGMGVERLLFLRTHVVDDATGAPLERYFVGVRDEGGGSGTEHPAPDGWYATPARKPGTYQVSIKADGYAAVHRGFEDWPAGTHELEFRLRRAAPLRVRLVDGAGRPLVGAAVEPVDEHDEPLSFNGRAPGRHPGTHPTTGYDGRCWFESVPSGAVRLRLTPLGSDTSRIEIVEAGAGEHVLVL